MSVTLSNSQQGPRAKAELNKRPSSQSSLLLLTPCLDDVPDELAALSGGTPACNLLEHGEFKIGRSGDYERSKDGSTPPLAFAPGYSLLVLRW